jgi:uncharacterized membrane protein YfcA
VVAAALIGIAAGVVAGMLGIGGGVLFVPALVYFADLSQLDAEATSLLAIVPVALIGAWRQRRYGNLRLRDGLLVGVLAVPGSAAGVVVANIVPERALQIGFAVLLLFVAAQLVRSALRQPAEEPRPGDRQPPSAASA